MNPWRAAASIAVLALLAVGAVRPGGPWQVLAFPLAAWLLLGNRSMPGTRAAGETALTATRTLGATFPMAGAPVAVTISVENRGPRIEYLRLTDGLPPGAVLVSGSPAWRGSLPAGSRVEIAYTARFRRGRHDFSGVMARLEDPLGADRRDLALDCPGTVVVPPLPMRAPSLVAGPGAVRPYSGRSGARRPGEGAEFHGTRDYSPGDRLRNLNWRAGALWGQSIVNVFEGDRAIDAGIILDCRADAYRDGTGFEASAAAALSLAEWFLDGGNRVAFMLYGSSLRWIPPGAGSAHRYRIRAAAAGAELGDHAVFERFDHLPSGVFPPRSLVILVSPLKREDLPRLKEMLAQGYSVLALRPLSPETAGHGGSGDASPDERAAGLAARVTALEDRLLHARLAKAGVTVMDWDIRTPLMSAGYRGSRP